MVPLDAKSYAVRRDFMKYCVAFKILEDSNAG
jgi:hypothetical protein